MQLIISTHPKTPTIISTMQQYNKFLTVHKKEIIMHQHYKEQISRKHNNSKLIHTIRTIEIKRNVINKINFEDRIELIETIFTEYEYFEII